MVCSSMRALAAFSLLLSTAAAHSWPEYINKIDNSGGLTGPGGYPRSWMRRTDKGWTDNDFTNRIIQVNDSTMACSPKQTTQHQTDGLGRLKVNAGDLVAIRYLENGHVTKPQVPPGKPDHTGTVFIFGSQDVVSPKLEDMLKWTNDGKGGDGKGKLLVTQPFDDGMCYQVDPASPIYKERAQKYPNNNMELPCQADFKVPQEAKVGSPYSIFWYWNWTTVSENANMQNQELYTSCIDFDISNDAPADQGKKPSFNSALPIATQAVAAYFNTLVSGGPATANQAAAASPQASQPNTTPAPASPAPNPAGEPVREGADGKVTVASSAAAGMASAGPASGKFDEAAVHERLKDLFAPSANKNATAASAPASAAPSAPSVVPLSASIQTSAPSATPPQQPSTLATVISSSAATAAAPTQSNPVVVNMDPNSPFQVIEDLTMGTSVFVTTLPHATNKPASFTLVLGGNVSPAAATGEPKSGTSGINSSQGQGQSQSQSQGAAVATSAIATATTTTPATNSAGASSAAPHTGSSGSSSASTTAAPNTMAPSAVAGGRAQFTSSQPSSSAASSATPSAAPSMGAPSNSSSLGQRGLNRPSRLFVKAVEEMARHQQ